MGIDEVSWLAADPRARLAVLEELARASSRELRAVMAPAEPRRLRFEGARIVHRRTGLRFCYVPGPAPFLLAEEVLATTHAPLLGVDPKARARVLAPDAPDDAMPLYLAADELDRILAAPFRLPSDSEWAFAYRAGSTSDYPREETAPSAPPADAHPLGLVAMGWYDELTADGTLRGGAAMTWPWRADDPPELTWGRLHARFTRPYDASSLTAVRVAISL